MRRASASAGAAVRLRSAGPVWRSTSNCARFRPCEAWQRLVQRLAGGIGRRNELEAGLVAVKLDPDRDRSEIGRVQAQFGVQRALADRKLELLAHGRAPARMLDRDWDVHRTRIDGFNGLPASTAAVGAPAARLLEARRAQVQWALGFLGVSSATLYGRSGAAVASFAARSVGMA
jgi:hypothetical protein